MAFYRPGGSNTRINAQYDEVYADFIGGATGFLPVNKGDWIAVNLSRALLNFHNAASSEVRKQPTAYEAVVLLEMKSIGGQSNGEAWPIDQWQNVVTATGLRAQRAGWVRLRILSINNQDGTGIAMALQVSRNEGGGM